MATTPHTIDRLPRRKLLQCGVAALLEIAEADAHKREAPKVSFGQ